ncbi:hypothetical protein Tsubulata_043639 [Turnera subulata]|uniref:RRM domain-containing protein n=1 Tax=Turnera subulata TaxID=218843 RepID=A0A9Q0FVH4_9ROSI|nr:hypothetical protein Tsubulata_043639 [Turnera subulata]
MSALPYFSKWSRQQVQGAMDNGILLSLYVENLAEQWKPTDVYRIMSKYGEVVDVYIPNRQSRSRKRFGFVRFRGIGDVQRLLNDVNRVQVGDGVVRANIARRRNQGPDMRSRMVLRQDTRPSGGYGSTYAHAVGWKSDARAPQVQPKEAEAKPNTSFIPSTDVNAWLARSAVGVVKNPKKMESVCMVWKLHDMDEVEVMELGGDSVLVCFSSPETMLSFTQQPPDWVRFWFRTLSPWKQGDKASNRRCWVTIRGVPLNAWCSDFFEMVGTLQVTIAGSTYSLVIIEEAVYYPDMVDCSERSETGAMDDRMEDGDSEEDRTEPGRRKEDRNGKKHDADFQEETQDPFGILQILRNNHGHDTRQDTLLKDHADSAVFMRVNDAGSRNHPADYVGGVVTCGCCNQLTQPSMDPVYSPKPIRLSNSFGPLEGGGLEAESAQVPVVSSPLSTSSAASSSRTVTDSSKKSSSPASRSSSYLVRRLDAAIKSARVSQRRKLKKNNDNGSVTVLSPTRDAIPRANEEPVQAGQTSVLSTPPVCLHELEAIQTVQMGDALEWEVCGNTMEVVTLAKDLVDKESVEWRKTQVNV